MLKNIGDLMFTYPKRSRMRATVMYSKIKDIWLKSILNDKKEYGNLEYLIRECNSQIKQVSGRSFKRSEWAQFYLNSGTARTKNNSYGIEQNEYYGRTLEDLYNLAERFMNELAAAGLNIDIKGCINFVYSEIVDAAYFKYVKLDKLMISLKELYSGVDFAITDMYSHKDNDVDLFGLKNGVEICAIKIINENQDKNALDDITKQKHQIFESINGIPVTYLKINSNNEPLNRLVF